MAGYANRLITETFPELTQAGDPVIHVIMRNPRLVPPDEMRRADIAVGPDGAPVDEGAAKRASDELMAKLITGWLVYDASAGAPEGDAGRLPLPATAESVAKLPMEIINRLAERISSSVNPQKPTPAPEGGTGTTS